MSSVRLLLLLAVAGCASARPEPESLHRILNEQAATWSAGDLEAFVAFYAADAVFVSPSGETRGRQAIFERYVKRYRDGGASMGTLRFEFLDTQISADGTLAAVTLKWHIDFDDKAPASGHALVTLVRANGQWHIHQDASM
ncbi:MAG: nuclear transport factor 2 family protein [Myxococcota bacterium]